MSFLVRIFFSGLMAFVPTDNGQEVTVLLLNVEHNAHTSDGSMLAAHKSLVFADGGSCSGTCPVDDPEIAKFVYVDKSLSLAQSSLQSAVSGGGAWILSGSDLSLRKGSTSDPDLPSLVIRDNVRGTSNGAPQLVPTTAAEAKDFTWIADLRTVCPGCTYDPSLFGSNPPAARIAARLRLRNGTISTHSLARIGSNVTPVHFKRLDGTGDDSSYSQAIATWVVADIEVSGNSIELVEEKFDGSAGRTMKLTPDANGKVEIAVLNLPPFVPPASSSNDAPQIGKHFEAYYDLLTSPPSPAARLVPIAGAASGAGSYPSVSWTDVHPSSAVWSDLLNALRMETGRSLYDRILCPSVR